MTRDVPTEERLDRLESLVERQQDTIERQRERIADLEAPRDGGGERTESDRSGTDSPETAATLTRRTALKSGGLLGLVGLGTGVAAADAGAGTKATQQTPDPRGQVGTADEPLRALYTEEVNGGVTDGSTLTDLFGNGLMDNGTALTVDISRTGSGVGVLDTVTTNGVEYRSLSGRNGLSVTEGDGTITIGATRTTVTTESTGETVSLPTGNSGSTADRGADGLSETNDRKHGLKIGPNIDRDAIEVQISSNTSGATTVYLTDTDGNVLTTAPFPGSGNWVRLTHSISAGDSYYALVDAEGSDYTVGYRGAGVSWPVESADVDITATVTNGGYESTRGDAYAIRKVRTNPTDATTEHVTFSDPTPVDRWETATFQADQDGETVEVYVETNDGDGWSDWRSDPIGPGTDLSAVHPHHRVRFRVELARQDSDNDPRLTSPTLQWRPQR